MHYACADGEEAGGGELELASGGAGGLEFFSGGTGVGGTLTCMHALLSVAYRMLQGLHLHWRAIAQMHGVHDALNEVNTRTPIGAHAS